MATPNIKTDCSGCRNDVVIRTEAGSVTMRLGSKTFASDLTGDEDLWMWDCPNPACDYADSFDPNFDVTRGS